MSAHTISMSKINTFLLVQWGWQKIEGKSGWKETDDVDQKIKCC